MAKKNVVQDGNQEGMQAEFVTKEGMCEKFRDTLDELGDKPLKAKDDERYMLKFMKCSTKRKTWPAWGAPIECLPKTMSPGAAQQRKQRPTPTGQNYYQDYNGLYKWHN